jgi:branched-chain amino acid transport system substrate-binding protein
MKRFANLITVTIFLTAIFALLFAPGCAKKSEPSEIKIGAILPLTGDAALAGVNTRSGMELAVEQISDMKVEIVYEDTQASPKIAVSAVNKLITYDKVSYIVDNSISGVTLAVSPICEKNGVVLLATGASSPKITQAGNCIFRIWNSDDYEGQVIGEYAKEILNIDKIAILFVNNDYGFGLKEAFRKAFGQVDTIESFEQESNEYRTQLAKIIGQKPQAIYLVGYSKNCIQIFKQARESGYEGIWFGSSVMLDPSVIEAVRATSYKLYYPSPVKPDSNSQSISNFNNSYQSKYRKEPPALADVGYDAIMLYKQAVRLGGGYDGNSLKSGLMKIKRYEGASGIIEFDENGDVHKPIEIKTVNS